MPDMTMGAPRPRGGVFDDGETANRPGAEPPTTPVPDDHAQPSGLRVLVVDDDPSTRLLIRRFLKESCIVEECATAESAVRLARDQAFDLVLLDINLGDEFGGEYVLRWLREMPGQGATPAVAVTAYAMPGDRERFLGAGFDGYLSKPFSRQHLEDAMRGVMRQNSSG
jgi:CheY-like chemotaxis protein